jgi:hypothetical protein
LLLQPALGQGMGRTIAVPIRVLRSDRVCGQKTKNKG